MLFVVYLRIRRASYNYLSVYKYTEYAGATRGQQRSVSLDKRKMWPRQEVAAAAGRRLRENRDKREREIGVCSVVDKYSREMGEIIGVFTGKERYGARV